MKRLLAGFIFFLAMYGIWSFLENGEQTSFSHNIGESKKPPTVKLDFATKKFPPVRHHQRVIASSGPSSKPEKLAQVKISKKKIPLGKSFQLAEEVLTLPIEQFKDEMGKVLKKDNHYVFFSPTHQNVEGWPVAFHHGRQKFYPISHILHVKGVTPELRQELLQKGLKEYYYHAPLKLLSLRSTPTRVLKQYEELTSMGLTVRLEVLKELPQLK